MILTHLSRKTAAMRLRKISIADRSIKRVLLIFPWKLCAAWGHGQASIAMSNQAVNVSAMVADDCIELSSRKAVCSQTSLDDCLSHTSVVGHEEGQVGTRPSETNALRRGTCLLAIDGSCIGEQLHRCVSKLRCPRCPGDAGPSATSLGGDRTAKRSSIDSRGLDEVLISEVESIDVDGQYVHYQPLNPHDHHFMLRFTPVAYTIPQHDKFASRQGGKTETQSQAIPSSQTIVTFASSTHYMDAKGIPGLKDVEHSCLPGTAHRIPEYCWLSELMDDPYFRAAD